MRVFRRADMREMVVPRPAEIGIADIDFAQGAANSDPASTTLQVRFSGPLHPNATYDFETRTGELSLRKRSLAWQWFDPKRYEVKRIAAPIAQYASVRGA